MKSGVPTSISPLRFLGICALFLFLSNWLPDAVFAPLNLMNASLAGDILSLAGQAPRVRGDLITLEGFSVRIVTECTAIYAILLLAAFVLAWPATWRRRLAGICIGGAAITAINLLRIAGIAMIGARDAAMFEIIHVYLGQVVMLLLVIGCCLAWVNWCTGRKGDSTFLFRAVCWATILFLPWLAAHKVYLALLDAFVRRIFSLLRPEYALLTPLPLAIYNHAFSIPIFIALIMACRGVALRPRIFGVMSGVIIISLWNALFRATHVLWTAYGVEGVEPLHNLVYLLGQFMLPVFLWLMVVLPPAGLVKGLGRLASRCMPLLLISLFIALPAGARGEALVSIEPNGRGGFTLRADGLNRIAGGEIRLDYMSYVQGAPDVSVIGLGAQAGLQAAADSPGSIVFSFTGKKPLNGGGMLATVTLGGRDGDPGRILSLSALLRNDKGVEESAGTSISNPGDEGTKPPPAAKAKTWKRDRTPIEPAAPEEAATSQEITVDAPAASGQPLPDGAVPLRRLESVLDRFRGRAGEMTREAVELLFAPPGEGEFQQEPAVLLADGSAEMELTIRVKREGETVKCFLTRGARCTSLWNAGPGEWLLVLTPDRGTVSASVTVLTNLEMIEYPLTVAPPLPLFREAAEGEDIPCLREFVKIANERAAQYPPIKRRSE